MKQSLFFSAVVLLTGTLQLSDPADILLIDLGSIPLEAEPAVFYQPRIAKSEMPYQISPPFAEELDATLSYWDLLNENDPLF